jgi:N-acyl-D-aspartate/D-glutamate deacylase
MNVRGGAIDLAIRNGDVVDGTGAPRRRADVGIHEGRIVAIGDVGAAADEIDATGRIVAPGFVDVHSHFDAQVFWDPLLTPSCLHGITTTFAGNCGFTLAPLVPDAVDYLVRMLAVVEGMPLPALRAGVPGDWSSTGEFLDRIDGTLGINIGFMVGHSALRRVVMGADATRRAATGDEIEAMKALLRAGLDAGGMGFSSSWGVAHFDGDGDPVPSLFATPDELVALAAVCRDYEGTSLEFLPNRVDRFAETELELLTSMSTAAGRPLNWNVIRITDTNRDETEHVLAAGTYARDRGGKVVALNMPIPSRARFSFLTGFVLDALPGWGEVLALPVPERLRALRDPAVRVRLAAGAAQAKGGLAEIAEFANRVISQTFTAEAAPYQGRHVAELAAERGTTPLDALLDVVCADELQTTFMRPVTEPSRADWVASAEAWRDGRAMIGASDAGAHLDFTAYFDYPVYILEKAVRDHGVLTVEEAVHLMTDVPAHLYGVRQRGRLAVGNNADVVVFDPGTIASGEITTRFDLPAGAGRLYAEPIGIDHVVVNGRRLVSAGTPTAERPGTLLRAGRDTETPSLA